MNYRVLILVSTFNGEKYLSQQLDSLLCQQNVDVFILVRDDGSSDNTIDILKEYSFKYSNITYYQGNNIGPCLSFFDLLKHAGEYDYYAFCDQDDVWDKDKLEHAVLFLSKESNETPTVYCSNLKVVDKSLNFCHIVHRLVYNPAKRYAGLVDFYAVGCTEVFNKKALDFTVQHIRKDCIMHDSWVFMICNFFGKVIYDSNAYINYRQHERNVIGTKVSRLSKMKDRVKRATDKSIQPRLKNAQILIDEFGDKLNTDDLRKIKKMAVYKDSLINRVNLFFDFDISSNHFLSDLRYRMLIIISKI